jgi:hypothetical protein
MRDASARVATPVATRYTQPVHQNTIPAPSPPPAPRLFDPARASARLLGWFGMSALMVLAPLVGVLSRRSLFVLLPIGGGLLLASFLIAVSGAGLRAFRAALFSPVGIAASFLWAWAVLSLAWTPFPGDVAPSVLASLTMVTFATLLVAHLPRTRLRPVLYLLPAGVLATTLATLAAATLGPPTFRGGSEFDPSLIERSVLTLDVLVWPSLGALSAFGRWRLAAALAVLVAAVVVAFGGPLAMAIYALGAIAFALAADVPLRVSRSAGILFASLVLIAPLLPFALAPIAANLAPVGRSTVAAMWDWRELVAADGLRLVTGHGIGTAAQGVGLWLPPHTPRTTLFEVWYELGAPGALLLAATIMFAFRGIAGVGRTEVPSLLAGAVVTMSIAMFGLATAQVWFVTLASLQAVAYGLLLRSSYRSDAARPLAPVEPFPPVSTHGVPTLL